MSAPPPPREEERLAALEAYDIMDSETEEAFDDLVAIASTVCRTPIALISLVDGERQWFKARKGLQASQTPREDAFCAHAILDKGTTVVPDATRDERFKENPLVTRDPSIRFYAGAPLQTTDGLGLGTICVIDTEPRKLEDWQIEVLESLSRQAMRLMELRKISARLADSLQKIRTLGELLPVCAWCRKVRSDDEYWVQLEEYVTQRSDTRISHGICPDCSENL
ncbi:MAG: GAF domain-containing protein [Gemmatimonadales bacterium]|nr:MAG: GAF domain-containing protein [Gemmatimonadales bacterium]